jgi:D-3-phosphoglycerate dehydrogenase
VKNGTVLLADTFHPIFSELLIAAGFVVEEGYQLTSIEISQRINEWDGLAIRSRFKIDNSFLVNASRLRFIARGGAGMENIDLIAANDKGIACLSAPEGNRDAVGEKATAMLLMLMNNLLRADHEVRQGQWNREKNRGYELQGKTIGIIGYGNMGSAFAQRLQGFDVKVLAYDKYISIQTPLNYVQQAELNELFKECDVISLHLPLTEETDYFANAAFFAAFQKPIWFVNTARGKNTDTAALVTALQSGKVKGAALDVLEYESVSFEDFDHSTIPAPLQYLFNSDNVVLSPHIGGWTFESHEKIAKALVSKILAL